MDDARRSYESLDEPWRIAIAEAWTSWSDGSAGVGAVVSRASTGEIVAVGRNRILEPRTVPGVLASTVLAHAEMNALAVLPLGPTADFVLTTTFEPCLMCRHDHPSRHSARALRVRRSVLRRPARLVHRVAVRPRTRAGT